MIRFLEKISKYFLIATFLFLFAFSLSSALADDNGNGNGNSNDNSDVEEIPLAPADPDISDICTPSDCSPAKACPDSDQSCYTINGAFYCCTEPPSPGAEAVGD